MEAIIENFRRKLVTKTPSQLNVSADQFLDKALKDSNTKNLDEMIKKFCLIRKLSIIMKKPQMFCFSFFFFCSESKHLEQSTTKSKWV